MGLRDRLANLFSKGDYSKQKAENVMLSNRPSLARYEREQEFLSYTVWQQSYYLEENVAVFSEVVQALRRETFRNGLRWKPHFVKKCLKCDNEMQEKAEACDHCGSVELRDPNASEMKLFGRIDGTDFLQKANKNDQTLNEILFNNDFHLNVCDLGYILILKKYVLADDGSIKEAIPAEILALDPRDIEFVHTPDGMPGGGEKLCLKHRNNPQGHDVERCPKCGSVLYDVHFKSGKMAQLNQYYIEGEVLKVSKYYPSLVYGYPPIIKMVDDAWAYHYIEKRVRSYYEKGRPPGILSIPTNNIEGQQKLWKDINLELRQDPYAVPWMAVDPEAKNAMQFLNLMMDPNADMLEVKKDLRERFGSRFGVSMIFQADTSVSGGLNNEGLQITVTNRAVQWGQSIYNDKVLPWICKQFGIKDYVLELAPSEEMDEMAEIQRKTAEAQWAQIMFQMGFDVEYEDAKFKVSGLAKKPEPPPSPFGMQPQFNQGGLSGSSVTEQEPSGTPEDVEKSLDELTHEEFCDSLFDKSFVFTNAFWLLKAIMIAPLMGRFQKLAPQEAEHLYDEIIKVMINSERWSLTEISSVLKKKFPELTDYEAERIARTETTMIANKARELQYTEKHPESKYIWIGPDDHRTTEICKTIKERQPNEGLSLDDLKKLIRDVAFEKGETQPRDWLPHIGCRHTFRRVMTYD